MIRSFDIWTVDIIQVSLGVSNTQEYEIVELDVDTLVGMINESKTIPFEEVYDIIEVFHWEAGDDRGFKIQYKYMIREIQIQTLQRTGVPTLSYNWCVVRHGSPTITPYCFEAYDYIIACIQTSIRDKKIQEVLESDTRRDKKIQEVLE